MQARLEEEGESLLASTLENCGHEIGLKCQCCGLVKVTEIRCKKRWCPVCQRALAAKRNARYALAIGLMQWPLHLTLTVPHQTETYRQRITKLKKGVIKLRRKRVWTDHVRGGVVGFEIDSKNGTFHPHAHFCLDCRWLGHYTKPPQRGDSRATIKAKCMAASQEFGIAWARCLGLNAIPTEWVGVCWKTRRVKDAGVSREILKYAVKGSDLVEHEEPIGPIIRALDGCRMVSSFGSCFGKLRATDDSKSPPRPCEKCGESAWVPETGLEEVTRLSRAQTRV